MQITIEVLTVLAGTDLWSLVSALLSHLVVYLANRGPSNEPVDILLYYLYWTEPATARVPQA